MKQIGASAPSEFALKNSYSNSSLNIAALLCCFVEGFHFVNTIQDKVFHYQSYKIQKHQLINNHQLVPPCIVIIIIQVRPSIHLQKTIFSQISTLLGMTSLKKNVYFQALPESGGGGPCPKVLALFSQCTNP